MFQQRKHKRFNYIPRHLRDSKSGDNLKSHWESVRGQGKHKSKQRMPLVILLVILGMIIALWYVLTHYETS
ncbi:hypothetical protein [Psychroserpens algicola]|uniref:Uncharacterized protein n=1 Tax=Psychroserpens algicola TaxID=1719034 RepID=A0ABT0HAT0_9FLAO|nr:hypothetical protein [Psychroserpens algicola]MCK8481451.1 hypothetical protein [Psychroserpens algicola]